MLDDRVRDVLARLEVEGADEGVPRTTVQFLFALVAPQTACEVLEIGGSSGYSTIWLAAGVRYLGGRVVTIEHDPQQAEAWRRNIAEAELEEWAELVEGDPVETLERIEDVFDVVILDADERLFDLARLRVEPGALLVARGGRGRQEDPTLVSVTVPLDRGLELSVVIGPRHFDALPP